MSWFWISGDMSSEFQSQSGFCLIRVECNVHSLRSTSGLTHCQPLYGQHCGVAIFGVLFTVFYADTFACPVLAARGFTRNLKQRYQ